MLFAAPAFAQSIDLTQTPGPDGAVVEFRVTQVVTTPPGKAFVVNVETPQQGTFSVASDLVPAAVFAIGSDEDQNTVAPLRQLLDRIALPSLMTQTDEGHGLLRGHRSASSEEGVGLTPREVRDLQAQVRRDADAALAQLKS